MPFTEQRIVNGGFEELTDGWDSVGTGTGNLLVFPFTPHTGFIHLICDPDEGDTWGITQTVKFTDVDELTFWQGLAQGLMVYIDDELVGTYDSTLEWTEQTVDVSGYTGNCVLKFLFGDSEWSFLDDISAFAERDYWYDTPPTINKNTVWNIRKKRGV
jgi:hypothetical protein